jgi:aminopeptidase-like protein
MVVAVRLAALLGGLELRYSYRFIWIPGTIGAITWLALNEPLLPRIAHGLVLSCVGDPGPFTYKRSRRGRALIDRTVEHVLRTSGEPYSVRDFVPTGYDERQYCSPGIDLPVGCFMRTPNGEFPEYHTSGDNLALVTPAALAGSLLQLLRVVANLEADGRYLNLYPKGEPQLGRRGLYKPMGGTENTRLEQARRWMLNMSDGGATLLDIAERSGFDVPLLAEAADELAVHGLLGRLDDSGPEPTQQ